MPEQPDQSVLSETFGGLSSAAKDALIQAGLHSPQAVARSSEQHLRELEGIDDMSITIIRQVLAEHGLELPKE